MDMSSKKPPLGEKPQVTDTHLLRIPSVLPDADTSPTYLTPEDRSPDPERAEGGNLGDVEAGRKDNNGTLPGIELQRTTTAPSPHYSLPLWRKSLIVFTSSITTMCATFAATSLFPLTGEISASLRTSESTIIAINAVQIAVISFSGFVWGPLGRIMGRKPAWLAASAVLALTTVGAALAPLATPGSRLGIFIAMRILSGFQGTTFHVMGQSYIAEIFIPTERGTAAGFFFVGSTFGPAFGPCIAGVMVTYVDWTSILWLQAAMLGVAMIVSILVLPNITNPVQDELKEMDSRRRVTMRIVQEFNPIKVFRVVGYPNILLSNIASGFVSWNQYTLLAAPRHLFAERFNFDTPLAAGLFYIAPGIGFMMGTVVGGRYCDLMVIKWIKIRGFRLPQDRLRSGMISFFVLIPVSSLIYGWGLHYEVGGLALPIVTAWLMGISIMMSATTLATYSAEAMPKKRTEVIGSKYLFQFAFSAVGSGVMVPLIDAIGVGPAQTIATILAVLAGVLIYFTSHYGLQMQQWAERRFSQKNKGWVSHR